jgi:hypothetical protein
MKPLPLPVRIAAGLVASAVEQARDLPRIVVEFPVTAVSQALQVSMRMQQKVTELAIKGDRALDSLRPVDERPSWATFDDEEEEPSRNGAGIVTELRPARPEDGAAPIEPSAESATAVATGTIIDEPAIDEPAIDEPATDEPATDANAADENAADVLAGPNVLPGYASLTIPQLRGRLRHLGVDDLRALLAWETSHENRPPFVTMLSNRITTVTEA